MNAIPSLLHTVSDALFTPHILYLAVVGTVLLGIKWSDKQFSLLVYLLAALYFQLFYGQYIHVFTIAGDNICQIAYWKILFRPNLAGSVGASYTKPVYLVFLGLLYEISQMYGEIWFQIGLSLAMAACVWILVKISTDVGGREAGLLTFITATAAFLLEFTAGSYVMLLIATTFIGLRLYYYSPGHKNLGRFMLVLSIQFHIETIAILAIIWLILVIKKQWRELATFTGYCLISIMFWFLVILRIQKEFHRIHCSGIDVGYLGPNFTHIAYNSKMAYICSAFWLDMTRNYSTTMLFVLAAIGVIGAIRLGYLYYTTVFAVFALLIINVFILMGGIELSRHAAVVYGFSCSVGIATFVLVAKKMFAGRRCYGFMCRAASILALFLVVIIFATFTSLRKKELLAAESQPFAVSAANLLADKYLPYTMRLMTEDDILYPLVILAPDRYPSLTTLQRFNTSPESVRKDILGSIDYIWIATNGKHDYYYLNFLSEPEWSKDTFRTMITDMLQTRQVYSMYGYRFVPIDMNAERLIIKVEQIAAL